MKLYVGNLLHAATEKQVKTLFEQFGEVVSVKIIKDKLTGASKGFAFVEYTTEEDAEAALEGLNGKPFEGRTLRIDKARAPQPREGGFGGDRGGDRRPSNGGGYGPRRNTYNN